MTWLISVISAYWFNGGSDQYWTKCAVLSVRAMIQCSPLQQQHQQWWWHNDDGLLFERRVISTDRHRHQARAQPLKPSTRDSYVLIIIIIIIIITVTLARIRPLETLVWSVASKATGNSRSGIPGNRGPPKFPAGIPGNFRNSGGNYGEFREFCLFFPFLLLIMTF